MTKEECIRFYMKIVEAGREVEKIQKGLSTILGADIETFDYIHDKLADVAFQAIISIKFKGNPPNQTVEHDFVKTRIDQHMNDYLEMVSYLTEKESPINLYDWIEENIRFLLND